MYFANKEYKINLVEEESHLSGEASKQHVMVYPDSFVDGIGILAEVVLKNGGKVFGSWSTEGYDFDEFEKLYVPGKSFTLSPDDNKRLLNYANEVGLSDYLFTKLISDFRFGKSWDEKQKGETT